METTTPLSAKRLHALMGDKMHELPAHFIEQLEQKLRDYGDFSDARRRAVHLQLVPDITADAPLLGGDHHADLKRHSKVAVPIRTLQGLAAILEILHSVEVGKQEGGAGVVAGAHLVEGLIVSARAMVKASADAMWGPA